MRGSNCCDGGQSTRGKTDSGRDLDNEMIRPWRFFCQGSALQSKRHILVICFKHTWAPKHLERYRAFALMVTLVWLAMEILRLLAKLRER